MPSPTPGGFPYPHGDDIPFGMMACDDPSPTNPCVEAGFTLFHASFASVLSVDDQIDWLRAAKDAGILEKFMVTTPHDGPTGYRTYLEYFQALRDRATQEGLLGWAGLHHRDEAGNLALTQEIHDAYLSVFPEQFTFLYGQDEDGATWASAAEVAGFTGYTDYHDRPAAFPYFNLSHHGYDLYGLKSSPSWNEMGRTIWLTTEGFDDITIGEPLGSTACTRPDAYQRSTHQIVQSVLGGAQGIYSYAGVYAYESPCLETIFAAHQDFLPKYRALWPWIEEMDRTKLPVTVLSGPDEACSGPVLEYDICDTAVVAFQFVDADGREMIAVVNLLDNQEAGGGNTRARISGIPDGQWDVWYSWGATGGSVEVTDGTITDTWAPYGYTFYVKSEAVDPGSDGRSDIGIYVPNTGHFWVSESTGSGLSETQDWLSDAGAASDERHIGDFDGDGRVDLGVYVPSSPPGSGRFWVAVCGGGSFAPREEWTTYDGQAGWGNEVRHVGDYNGDGKSDLGIYVPSTGHFWVAKSTGSAFNETQDWLADAVGAGDERLIGDFNGDGKSDVGVYVPSSLSGNGRFWVALSNGGSFAAKEDWTTYNGQAGWGNEVRHVGDYDGDGKSDIGIYVPSTGQFWVALSTGSGLTSTQQWTSGADFAGTAVDERLIGDFDGDGRSDLGVWTYSDARFWVALSTGGTFSAKTAWTSYAGQAGWGNERRFILE